LILQKTHSHAKLAPDNLSSTLLKRQKNDAPGAAAIAEAALRSNMHCVAVKSAEHQTRAVAFRARQYFVGQCTQLINALRGHLAEFGLVVAKGPANLKSLGSMMDDASLDVPEGVRDGDLPAFS
jgi:transposase